MGSVLMASGGSEALESGRNQAGEDFLPTDTAKASNANSPTSTVHKASARAPAAHPSDRVGVQERGECRVRA
ncbi:hypothetical protein GCM10012319_28650 [Comamonas sp. KCTC 72670]|nr:hypothetical protein GCM10012319_28650 [Comamonas sp. KCTC 72670]